MSIGQVRVWFPEGPSHVVALLEEPKRGKELAAVGILKGAWVVSDVRASDDPSTPADVWVEDARSDAKE